MMRKVTITTSSFGQQDDSPIKLLKQKGYEITLNPHGRKVEPRELIELARDSIGIIAGTESLTAELLQKLPSLKVISRCGAGMENIDIAAAQGLGIKIFNTPNEPTLAVAELTVGLMLNLLRNISQMDRELHAGQWQKRMGHVLSGKKVGIVGLGKIGKKVAELLQPFQCQIAYADPFVDEKEIRFPRLLLEDLLSWADMITLHVSANDLLIGKKEFDKIKAGAWLVNTSRGKVVDEKTLLENLRGGRLAGAAIDVFEEEPYRGLLQKMENVILTPHIGTYAQEVRVSMEIAAVNNLLNALKAEH
ncbi:MAG: phosphoglycerate dehydrogenase [Candidatus Omnitrophota bacterium]